MFSRFLFIQSLAIVKEKNFLFSSSVIEMARSDNVQNDNDQNVSKVDEKN